MRVTRKMFSTLGVPSVAGTTRKRLGDQELLRLKNAVLHSILLLMGNTIGVNKSSFNFDVSSAKKKGVTCHENPIRLKIQFCLESLNLDACYSVGLLVLFPMLISNLISVSHLVFFRSYCVGT